jgi:hypothetical protein
MTAIRRQGYVPRLMAEALRRARDDLAAGRPWKARERLRSYVNAYPTDQKALELLGEVQYVMGDLPAAGAAWILCKRDDERVREAIEALGEEPHLLRVRAPMDAWPRIVQERLRAFGAEPEPEAAFPPEPRKATIGDRVALAGCLIGLVALGVFAVIGFALTVTWLV